MTKPKIDKGFVARHLDPASRLEEILFGLIMVLSVTLASEYATQGREGVRTLLIAALGCNIAWGFIDAAMYIMNCLTERAGAARLMHAVRQAPDDHAALEIIRHHAVTSEVESLTDPNDRESLYQSMHRRLKHGQPIAVRLSRDDFLGAILCFWLVFLSCLPAVIPFFIFSEPVRALRVSNALLIGMLFIVGYKWARHVGTNRLFTALTMVAIGLVLVGVAILLGG